MLHCASETEAMTLLDAIRDRDTGALDELLADQVTFNSPVRSYRERGQVLHLLSTIGGVVEELSLARAVEGPGETVAFVTARSGDERLDGVLDVRHDENGRAVEITLMLRPLGPLLRAVERMGQALAAD
jgi:hypothetical protein